MVGIEPTTGRLRSDYSTAELHRLILRRLRYETAALPTELHRLIDCLKHVMNALAGHQTLAIIPLAYSTCQASILPFLLMMMGVEMIK